MKDKKFETSLATKGEGDLALPAFNYVNIKFLGSYKDPDYKAIVMNMLDQLQELGCSRSIHFLRSHTDPPLLPESQGAVSEKQGGRIKEDGRKQAH
ncbi:hypothetical protein TNCV_3566721 [Trichonephila clavipes]|nr:hypothetical protein TNCV_3566721 [Trichonephila clavipes]